MEGRKGGEWAACLLAQEERRGVHWAEEMGRERERERARGRGLGDWASWVGFLGFLFLFLFSYFKHYSNLIEFKYKFEFNPSTQPIKEMLQHECTNILTL